MKTKTFLILIILLYLSILESYAQGNLSISTFYNYSIIFDKSKFYYPLGFGTNFSFNVTKNLLCTTGLEYSSLHDESQRNITGNYHVKEIYKESFASITTGASYSLLQKKISINSGGDIVASLFRSSLDYSRYTDEDNILDMHQKFDYESYGIGFRAKIMFQYSLSKNIHLFAQPGYTYYLFGELKKKKVFSTFLGLTFSL